MTKCGRVASVFPPRPPLSGSIPYNLRSIQYNLRSIQYNLRSIQKKGPKHTQKKIHRKLSSYLRKNGTHKLGDWA